ncbi:hypothetical protein [Streptomyces scabichelini]|uniref:hypothetical protein n=1 Tax=Streptomyces scabichelini TaxID=2711217 RepID=UPI0019D28518|nr:hypothetical protein [Streptomyces scabichelini]
MPSDSANYRTLLRTSGAAAFFLPAAVGRLGIAMTGIGIVWLVHARTGSYAAAGLVTGGFAVADAVAGGLALAAQGRTMPPFAGPAERRHAGRALLRSAFLRQVALGLTLGVFFGAMQVSVAAYAVGRGSPALLRLQLH